MGAITIVYLERLHLSHSELSIEKISPLYLVLENAEHKNCRLIFNQCDCYKELGPILECNIHNVERDWVHVTYPINAEDDVHKIISMDKIASVELINNNIAS